MEKGIVTRNDDFWQGHPDVAYFKGHFYVVFRQSKQHRETNETEIMLTKSRNGTRYTVPVTIAKSNNRYNCPRLSVIDNSLWIICDLVKQDENFIAAEKKQENTKIVLWSSNNGLEWSYPIETNITGIVPDRMCQTDDGGILIATHTTKKLDFLLAGKTEGPDGYLFQNVWKTKENMCLPRWTKYTLADVPGFNFCEASICNTGEELICLLRENSQRGEPCFWTSSRTHGETWTRPFRTRMFGGHRPVLGRLSSGNYMTTYREQMCSHIPGFWGKNTFACLTTAKSMHEKVQPCLRSIILPLDHDHSSKSDSGYTGWIETEDRQIYIVNYIMKDAYKPYIVWYLIDESEF